MSTDLQPIAVPGTDRAIMATAVNGAPMVSLRHACDAIGVAFDAQRVKLNGKSWASVTMIVTQLAGDTQRREVAMIDRRTFTMWLATIDANRVSPEARPIVEAFQAEAADALDAYFSTGVAVATPTGLSQFDVLRAAIDQIEVAQRDAEQARAIATKTEARLDGIEGKHDWYSALGYARHVGIENTSTQAMNRLGRQAASIARANGIAPEHVPHHLYGRVNLLPMWVWETAAAGREELAR